MNQNHPDYIRPSSFYRKCARDALRWRWKPALIAGLLLALIGGQIIGASVNFESASLDGSSFTPATLRISLGSFYSETLWNGLNMQSDLAEAYDLPGLVPLTPSFAAAAACAALLLLLLQPVYLLGMARLGMRVMQGEKTGAAAVRTGWREYWRAVGTLLLGTLYAGWFPMLIIFMSLVMILLSPDAVLLVALGCISILAASIVWIVREYSYAPALYLMAVQPEKTVRELLKESKQLIQGRRGRLFCLEFSFLGWLLLYALVAGIFAAAVGSFVVTTPVLIVSELLVALLTVPIEVYMRSSIAAFMFDLLNPAPEDAQEDAPAPEPAAMEEAVSSQEQAPVSPDSAPEQKRSEDPDDPWA